MGRSKYGGYEADKPVGELKAPKGILNQSVPKPQRINTPISSLTIEELCAVLNQYPFREGNVEKRQALAEELDKRIEWPKEEPPPADPDIQTGYEISIETIRDEMTMARVDYDDEVHDVIHMLCTSLEKIRERYPE